MQGVAGGEEEKRGGGEGQEPRGGAKGRRNTSPDERAAERRFKTHRPEPPWGWLRQFAAREGARTGTSLRTGGRRGGEGGGERGWNS